jgi:hypothetical protein
MMVPLEVSAYAIPLTAIKYVLKLMEIKLKSKNGSPNHLASTNVKSLISFMQYFEITKVSGDEEKQEKIVRLSQVLKQYYKVCCGDDPTFKNLKKNFSDIFSSS